MCTICSCIEQFSKDEPAELKWIATYVRYCTSFMGRLLFRNMQTKSEKNLKMEMTFTYCSIFMKDLGARCLLFLFLIYFFFSTGTWTLLFITYENHIRHELHTSFHHRCTGGGVVIVSLFLVVKYHIISPPPACLG